MLGEGLPEHFGRLARQDRHEEFSDLLLKIIADIGDEDRREKQRHDTQVLQWVDGDLVGPRPAPPRRFGEELESFLGDLFGYTAKINNGNLKFTSPYAEFDASGLSDGESQILHHAILLWSTLESKFLVLVDEPELHLNESRAIEIWQKIEYKFPNSVFIYATHSLSFASRCGVDKIFFLNGGRIQTAFASGDVLTSDVTRIIAGAQIIVSRRAGYPVFVEDEMLEFIVEDLIEGIDSYAVNARNSKQVIDAVSKSHGWDLIHSPVRSAGVIDRDFRDDADIMKLESKGVFCLKRFDAESFLLEPPVFIMMQEANGKSCNLVEYTAMLCRAAEMCFEDNVHALQAWIRDTWKIKIDVSPDGAISIKSTPPPGWEERASLRVRAMRSALETEDIDGIITHFKGKMLYGCVMNLDGGRYKYAASAGAAYQDFRRLHRFSVIRDEIPWLKDLSDRLIAYLAPTPV